MNRYEIVTDRVLGRALGLMLLLVSIVLSACGGGDSSAPSVSQPSLPSGTLDPSFGSDGKVITDFGGNAQASAVAVQPDGKIVVAGISILGFTLARYRADGSLDTGFGTAGMVAFQGGAGAPGLALQPDGKILLGGSHTPDSPYPHSRCVLARYKSDGTLDPQFGDSGIVIVGDVEQFSPFQNPVCNSIALQPDGKIVTALNGVGPIIALRLNSDGTPDVSFGAGGVTQSRDGGWLHLLKCRVAIRPDDGKIVVVATAISTSPAPGVSGTFGAALARFGPDGAPDSGFAEGGLIYLPDAVGRVSDVHYPETGDVVLLPDGKIVAAVGLVLRFLPSGALDSSFNRQVNHPVGTFVTSMALQRDGKLVAVAKPGFRVFRLMADGGLDLTFGDSRILDTIFGTARAANAVALQADGRIVVAGEVSTPGVDATGAPVTRQNFGVTRYIGDPVGQ